MLGVVGERRERERVEIGELGTSMGKRAIYRKGSVLCKKLSLPMGQVKGQGLEPQRNPCSRAEVTGAGFNHREDGQHGSKETLHLFR